jgi:HlyD family secretion protein
MNKGCLYGIVAAVVLASAFLGFYLWKKNYKPEASIEHYQAEYKTIVDKTVTSGSIKPRKEVFIKPQISGIVEEIYCKAGDMLKKGAPIVKIKMVPSPTNLNAAKSSVELAKINLRDAQRRLKMQQALQNEKWDIATTKENLALAKTEADRSKKLFNSGVISEQEYLQAKNQLDVANAAYENALANSDNSVNVLVAEVDLRKEELNQAENNLDLLEKGQASNSGQVSNMIRSTIDGMVLEIPVEEGFSVVERNNFNEGTTVATVADMDELIFEGTVDESDVGKLKEGMPINIRIGAIEDQSFDGRLTYIAPKGNELEGAIKFEVEASMDYPEDVFIRSGYSASGDIILQKAENVLTLKERDLFFENDSVFVEIHLGGKNYEKRLLETGISDGIEIEIKSGIDTSMMIKAQKIADKDEKKK